MIWCTKLLQQASLWTMNQPQAAEPLLRTDGLTKRFGPVVALDDVSFEVHAGEVVGLLGDNGAGKSTLIKIVSGALEPSAGSIWLDGRAVTFESPADAKALGIETVYQDLSLCPNVDTVANFFMGRELHRKVLGLRFLRERAMQAETERALADIGTEIPSVRTTVEHLSGGQRQAIELCRFVHWGGRLVLLDEPFAALGVAADPARPGAGRADPAPRRRDRGDHPQRPARVPRGRSDRGPAPRPRHRPAPRPLDQPRGDREPDHRRARRRAAPGPSARVAEQRPKEATPTELPLAPSSNVGIGPVGSPPLSGLRQEWLTRTARSQEETLLA